MLTFKSGFLLTFFFFMFSFCNAQHYCNCSVIVNPDFKGKLKLMDSTKKVIQYLKHNIEEEDFLILQINGETDSLFNVSVAYAINGHIANGWIAKNTAIGIYSKAYSGNLALYQIPDSTSSKQIISKPVSQLLSIVSCNGKWVKVSFVNENKHYVGWISPEMQCDNPYSTCN